MDRLVHTSLSALRGAMARQAATANNLANVNTVGFRGEFAAARSVWLHGGGASLDSRVLSDEQVQGADMRSGTVTETGRDLDVAVDGDAFFTVQAKNGDEAYTRRGDFQMSDTGLLTTGEGDPVLGEQGPVTIPPADSVKIEGDGSVWVVPLGSQVVKGLDGLFRVRGGGALPADPNAKVKSGALEGSNVEATKALVDMIDASRAWDTQLKLISTARELDGASADLMRLPD